MQLMREAVQQHRMEAWIAQQDFEDAASRGIFAKDRIDLLFDRPEH
jgi:hypothetical protein